VGRLDHLSPGLDQGKSKGALQFPHIPGPVICLQDGHGFGRNPEGFLAFLAGAPKDMFHQQGDISAALPQGRQIQGNHVDPVEKVLPERAFSDHRGEIAVSGACLTATQLERHAFAADVSRETLSLTTLGSATAGTRVNIEKALTAGQALGGHYVTGHVDGVGRVVSRHDDARSVRVEFEVPAELARYVARKGSVCVDGVSLTVNGAEGSRFDVNLVPHTLTVTVLCDYRPGTRVNLEVDIIARYVERMMRSSGR
jgi:riboflavin synthase alpha subunit